MPALITPTPRVRESFVAAMEEFKAEGRGTPDDYTGLGQEIRTFGANWREPARFARYVDWLLAMAREESPKPVRWVPATTKWYVEGDEYLGRMNLRHRLTPSLLELGGHIGYDVRPSARRRGFATAMLAGGLALAAGMGIGSALLTCDLDNVGSRRVIENNGGVLEDERDGKLRFWVPTGLEADGAQ